MNCVNVKKFFLLTMLCCLGIPMVHANAKSATFSANACPRNLLCTDDIVLITMSDFSTWKDATLLSTLIESSKNPADPTKDTFEVYRGGPSFHGFYYRVKPGKTYYFKATYYYQIRGGKTQHFSKYFYYKSRNDAHHPPGDTEGFISPDKAKSIGLPKMPKCQLETPGQFCTNQVVHVFWNNHRSDDKHVVSIDLYANGKFVKHEDAWYGAHFHDFYYTLHFPMDYLGSYPVRFQVTWRVGPTYAATHYENSQTLVSGYTPMAASACKLSYSWQKCQNETSLSDWWAAEYVHP